MGAAHWGKNIMNLSYIFLPNETLHILSLMLLVFFLFFFLNTRHARQVRFILNSTYKCQ